MKKVCKTAILLIVFAVLSAIVFTACDTSKNNVSGDGVYTVSFVADGNVVKTVDTKGNEVIAVPDAPEKEGFTFKGWYLDRWVWKQPFDGNNFASEALTHNVKVYAYYTENIEQTPTQYVVSFVADGNVIGTVSTAGNESIKVPQAPVKTDYEFKGWYLDANVWSQPFDKDYFADKTLTGNVYVYAYYVQNSPAEPEPVEYDVNFIADGVIVGTVTTAGNQVISLPAAPVKTDYEFKGWYLDLNLWKTEVKEDYFADKAIHGDVNVYAYYVYSPSVEPEPTEYDITFYADGDVAGTVRTAGNERIILPDAPAKLNYEFRGWYFDEGSWTRELTADYYAGQALTDNVSVYAYYVYVPPVEPEPTEYDITFYADGDVAGTVRTAGNERINLPDAPAKLNYEFRGWYFDEGGWTRELTADYYAGQALTGNVSVYAYYVYVAPKFTVNFDTDNGTYLQPVKTDVIQTAPVATKDGYDLEGWYLDPERNNKVVFPFEVSQDCTLYAKWVEKGVEFTLDSNNQINGVSNVPADGKIVIPEYVNGVKVAGIAHYAFRYNKDITSVEIPDGVTYLGIEVFRGCTNLQYVRLPKGMKSIPSQTFQDCTSLSSIELPDTLVRIQSDAFWGSGLVNVVIPDSVTEIWQYAFKNCDKLLTIDLGKVQDLSQGIFQGCKSLTSVTFPDTIKEIDANYTFAGCTSLKEVNYPDIAVPLNYNFVHETAYYDDPSNWVDGALYVGNHLVTVEKSFKEKTSFSVRPGTVTVGRLATYEADMYSGINLTSLTLPSSLKAIGERAFEGASKLTNVSIPDSVVRIYGRAFSESATDSQGYIGSWLIKYKGTGSTISIKEGTVGIADGEMTSSQSGVTQVVLPSTLKYIGAENFKFMSNLTSVNAPAGLVSIGKNAFSNCSVLQNFDLTSCNNLQSIGETAFSWCKAMTSLYVPSSVTYVGGLAFNQMPALTLTIARAQNDVPSTWNFEWNFTYASSPLNIVWAG